MASVDWIRTGYQSVNSYLVSDSADALIAWLSEVFACSERGEREIHSDGRSATLSCSSATRSSC